MKIQKRTGTLLPIPDYQSFFLPLLLLASDGNIHSVRDAIETLSNQFNLSDEERKALLPSGTQRIVDNRISWARTYLTNLITTSSSSSYSKEAVMWVSQVLILLKSKGLKLIIFMRSEVWLIITMKEKNKFATLFDAHLENHGFQMNPTTFFVSSKLLVYGFLFSDSLFWEVIVISRISCRYLLNLLLGSYFLKKNK